MGSGGAAAWVETPSALALAVCASVSTCDGLVVLNGRRVRSRALIATVEGCVGDDDHPHGPCIRQLDTAVPEAQELYCFTICRSQGCCGISARYQSTAVSRLGGL